MSNNLVFTYPDAEEFVNILERYGVEVPDHRSITVLNDLINDVVAFTDKVRSDQMELPSLSASIPVEGLLWD